MDNTYIRTLLISLQVLTILITAGSFFVIKFNDLKHLKKDFVDLKDLVETIKNNQEKIDKRTIAQETRCEERHKK